MIFTHSLYCGVSRSSENQSHHMSEKKFWILPIKSFQSTLGLPYQGKLSSHKSTSTEQAHLRLTWTTSSQISDR